MPANHSVLVSTCYRSPSRSCPSFQVTSNFNRKFHSAVGTKSISIQHLRVTGREPEINGGEAPSTPTVRVIVNARESLVGSDLYISSFCKFWDPGGFSFGKMSFRVGGCNVFDKISDPYWMTQMVIAFANVDGVRFVWVDGVSVISIFVKIDGDCFYCLSFGIIGSLLVCAALYFGVCSIMPSIIGIGVVTGRTSTLLALLLALRTRLSYRGWNDRNRILRDALYSFHLNLLEDIVGNWLTCGFHNGIKDFKTELTSPDSHEEKYEGVTGMVSVGVNEEIRVGVLPFRPITLDQTSRPHCGFNNIFPTFDMLVLMLPMEDQAMEASHGAWDHPYFHYLKSKHDSKLKIVGKYSAGNIIHSLQIRKDKKPSLGSKNQRTFTNQSEDFLSSIEGHKQSFVFSPHYLTTQAFNAILPMFDKVGLIWQS